MSTVTVFVDDAVQGHLPMVGATDGAPAEGLHRIHQSIGGASGWAWLLILFGPIGWIVLLAVLAFSGSARQLVVRLPYTHDALRRERDRFRAVVVSGVVMVASALGWFVAVVGPQPRSNVRETLMLLVGATALVAALATAVLGFRYTSSRPGIELDASGRWVTLRRVHSAFADACEAGARRSDRARPAAT
jgi:hypothetical protein